MNIINTGPVSLYVISEIDGQFIKIGVSQHPVKRLADLQSANARKLQIERTFELRSRNIALTAEARAHEILAHCRAGGEWFKTDANEAVDAAWDAFKWAKARAGHVEYRPFPIPKLETIAP